MTESNTDAGQQSGPNPALRSPDGLVGTREKSDPGEAGAEDGDFPCGEMGMDAGRRGDGPRGHHDQGEGTMNELPEDVRALFEGANPAHLATLLPDGSPHSVPVWVGVEGDRIAFQTSPGSRKARNIEREPRVSISITDADNPYSMAQVRGRVVERRDAAAAWEVIDRISEKYTGGPYAVRTDRELFLIEPEHTWAWAAG